MDRELFKVSLAFRNLSDEDPEEGVPPDTDADDLDDADKTLGDDEIEDTGLSG